MIKLVNESTYLLLDVRDLLIDESCMALLAVLSNAEVDNVPSCLQFSALVRRQIFILPNTLREFVGPKERMQGRVNRLVGEIIDRVVTIIGQGDGRIFLGLEHVFKPPVAFFIFFRIHHRGYLIHHLLLV